WEARTLNQLDISRDDPEIIQQTGIIGNQGDGDGTYGLEHDGENMWYCNGGRIWYVIDDGLGENSWLSSEPDEGEIEAGGDLDIIVTIDATGLIEGLYEAEIHILSNDPENNDVAINVRMDVTGVPIIEAVWEEEVGYPDVINWNEAYLDLFTGGAFEIAVTIANIGTAQLIVEDIYSESEVFTADQTNFDLNPGEEIALSFILETENEGVFESEMVVVWNSPDGEDYSIPVIARTFMPPVIEADQQAIETQLEVGDSEEHVLNLSNTGNSNLRFMIESEIISEPGMDFNERSFIRPVNNQSGPRRDDLGEIVGQHNVGEWGWTGLAYDGELMWGISPEAGMMAFDPMTSEIVENIELEREYYGMAFDGESFWVGSEGGDDNWMARLLRLDRNGQIEQTIVVQGWMATGVTFDGENLWYYSIGEEDGDRNIVIRQITVEGELIREINCNNIFEGNPLSLAYVSEHEDGNLWVIDWETRVLYQFDVSVDDPQILQQTQINGANIFGLEHDGENMWYCTINDIWYVIEDGISEKQWLTFNPEDGEIEPDFDLDIFVTVDATEFIEGAYEADLHFLSNDPNTPDLTVSVLMEIGQSSAPGETSVPISYNLSAAYPNPFNSSTRFDFDIPKSGFVSISIFDVSGRLIALIRDDQFEAGHHQIIWNADGFANGVYVVQLHVNDFHANTKVVLVK
ncbi:MAG: T9SS type A sorting domain-containing protein, partial [Calditrichaeota bacterium]|nr:T9SS type A sorting domain-containing protein [Calditrichota bacterium]